MKYTKGYYTKILKQAGIRKGFKEETGAIVSLKHLKTYQIIKLVGELNAQD